MLPYRAKMFWRNLTVHRRLADVWRLDPVPVAGEGMRAEVHMMLSRHHLARALTTMHLFLAHSGLADRVGVMFHLDGSVDQRRQKILADHFPGAALTDYPSGDRRLRATLEQFPACAEYYRRRLGCVSRLLHQQTLARCARIISLDTDVVFYGRPTAVVEWVDQGGGARYLIERRAQLEVPPHVPAVFDQVMSRLDPPAEYFRVRHYDFNAGLLLMPVSRRVLEIAEAYFAWHRRTDPLPTGFWFVPWALDQTVLHLAYASWPDAQPFDEQYVCGDDPSRLCNHLLADRFYHGPTLRRIGQELGKLRTGPAQAGGAGVRPQAEAR